MSLLKAPSAANPAPAAENISLRTRMAKAENVVDASSIRAAREKLWDEGTDVISALQEAAEYDRPDEYVDVIDGPSYDDDEEKAAAAVARNVKVAQRYRNTNTQRIPNFIYAANAVEMSARLYTLKVDDAYNGVLRFRGGLENLEGDEDAERKSSKKRNDTVSNREGNDTLETKPGALDKPIETHIQVDPLFQKTLNAFDEGGAKSILQNNLSVTKGCRLVFDSYDSLDAKTEDPEAFSGDGNKTTFEKRANELTMNIDLRDLQSLLTAATGGHPVTSTRFTLLPELEDFRMRIEAASATDTADEEVDISLPNYTPRSRKSASAAPTPATASRGDSFSTSTAYGSQGADTDLRSYMRSILPDASSAPIPQPVFEDGMMVGDDDDNHDYDDDGAGEFYVSESYPLPARAGKGGESPHTPVMNMMEGGDAMDELKLGRPGANANAGAGGLGSKRPRPHAAGGGVVHISSAGSDSWMDQRLHADSLLANTVWKPWHPRALKARAERSERSSKEEKEEKKARKEGKQLEFTMDILNDQNPFWTKTKSKFAEIREPKISAAKAQQLREAQHANAASLHSDRVMITAADFKALNSRPHVHVSFSSAGARPVLRSRMTLAPEALTLAGLIAAEAVTLDTSDVVFGVEPSAAAAADGSGGPVVVGEENVFGSEAGSSLDSTIRSGALQGFFADSSDDVDVDTAPEYDQDGSGMGMGGTGGGDGGSGSGNGIDRLDADFADAWNDNQVNWQPIEVFESMPKPVNYRAMRHAIWNVIVDPAVTRKVEIVPDARGLRPDEPPMPLPLLDDKDKEKQINIKQENKSISSSSSGGGAGAASSSAAAGDDDDDVEIVPVSAQLGGQSGESLHSTFRSMLNRIQERVSETTGTEQEAPSAPAYFVSLLLLANEKNLELRPATVNDEYVDERNKGEADKNYNLKNFVILAQLDDE